MNEQRRRQLPTSIQTFRKLREGDCYYVDKTDYAQRLAAKGGQYFLSRPRRFGKSLLVDTLKELFEGSKALFTGLAVHDDWDWSVRYPVVRLDFSQGGFKRPGKLHRDAMSQLRAIEQTMGLPAGDEDFAGIRCRDLIRALHETTGQKVVFLVDEYDTPILNALDEPEIAAANREYLRELYGTLKFSEAYIRFAFITGVSKFSKVSLFSGMNQLEDLTLDPDYSGICGYTDADLTTVFAPEFAPELKPRLDRDKIRDWYNGYCWLGNEKLYNPVSILKLFRRRQYRNWWFETATPAFLIETMAARQTLSVDLEGMAADDDLLSKFDVDDIDTAALLFQTGYLTITGVEEDDEAPLYTLGYPNREVSRSLNRNLLQAVTGPKLEKVEVRRALRRILNAGDAQGLKTRFETMLSGVPSDFHRKNPMARYEGWYGAMIYSYFMGAGYEVRVEDATNRGRIDLTLPLADVVWIFEFKVAGRGGADSALAQIIKRGYADKYRDGRKIVLVGIEFDETERNLVGFESAER